MLHSDNLTSKFSADPFNPAEEGAIKALKNPRVNANQLKKKTAPVTGYR
ncbi:hypothetical protein HmCmsJML021_03998 [Escherichia coli]|nr:hypothetical protein HmCmsJML021_03998 [Escherichia coli]